MRRLKRAAILLEMMKELGNRGSWCGETHLQKTAYFLQELGGVPMEFEFVLYRYGPFSFDLKDELAAMQADGLVRCVFQNPRYGPSIVATEGGDRLRERFPNTLSNCREAIRFVAGKLGDKGVSELERLATALYVSRKLGSAATAEEKAGRLHAVKPHVALDQARSAVEALDAVEKEAAGLLKSDRP